MTIALIVIGGVVLCLWLLGVAYRIGYMEGYGHGAAEAYLEVAKDAELTEEAIRPPSHVEWQRRAAREGRQ